LRATVTVPARRNPEALARAWDKLNLMLRPSVFIIQAAGLAITALCLEGSRTPSDKLEKPEKLTATILRLEQRLDQAESSHNVTAVEQMIAEDYRGITVGGGVISKQDVLKAVASTEEASSQSSEQEVRLLDNAAVYTALVIDHGTDAKTQQAYVLATRVMDIWQKRGRDWKLVNDQATAVPVDRLPH
jgi:hypothetical protein